MTTPLLPIGVALVCAPIAAWVDLRAATRAALVPVTTAAGDAGGVRARVHTIPARPFLVVIAAATTTAAQAAQTGVSWLLPAQLALITGLCALAACDAEWLLLPRVTVWWTTAAVAVAMLAGAFATAAWHRLEVAILLAGVTSAFFAAVSLANPRWLGFGDVRLAVPISLVLGWSGGGREVVGGMFVVYVLAAVVGVLLLLSRKVGRGAALPFGVFLAAGTIAALVASSR